MMLYWIPGIAIYGPPLKISLFHLTRHYQKEKGRSVSKFFFFFLKEGEWIPKYEKELHHDKTNKMIFALSKDSDQAGHPHRLIRVLAVRMKKPWDLSYPMRGQRRLWTDWADAQGCPVWSESLLGTQVVLSVLSWGGSYHNHINVQNSV